jgi:hypothetical protein
VHVLKVDMEMVVMNVCEKKYSFQCDDTQNTQILLVQCTPPDCNNHGTCNSNTGICQCDNGWQPPYCSLIVVKNDVNGNNN